MNEEEKEVIDDMLHEAGDPKKQASYDLNALKDTIREYVRSVTRILIRRNGNVLVDLPLSAGIAGGIIGAVAAPWAVITAAIAAAGFDCRVELIREDGEVVDLSPRRLSRAVREAGSDVASGLRDAVDDIRAAASGNASETECTPTEKAPDEEIPFRDTEDAP